MDILVLGYGLIINVITFLLFGLDKWYAKQEFRRIPEKTLLGISTIGGAIGAFLGMQLFRHKTRKARFSVGIPILVFLQVCISILIIIIF